MSINQNVKTIAAIRMIVVVTTFAFYGFATKLLDENDASKLFFAITILVTSELFIVGALEAMTVQKKQTNIGIKNLQRRKIIFLAVVSIAAVYKIENVYLFAAYLNALTRLKIATARANNNRYAPLFDGLPQSTLNIVNFWIITTFTSFDVTMTLLLTASIVMPVTNKLLFRKDYTPVVLESNEAQDIQVNLAIYIQFIYSSILSITLALMSGNAYREIFLAQRFGDSLTNISRVFQWIKVEKIKSSQNILSFSRIEFIAIIILGCISGLIGSIYGYVVEINDVYFLYLIPFIFSGIFIVFLANLTQSLIQRGLIKILLWIRLYQLILVIFGALIVFTIGSPEPLIIAAAAAQVGVFYYVRHARLHR